MSESTSEPVKVVAEAEINHNGDVETAKRLVDAAKGAGADFIKFQCFVADRFVTPQSPFIDIFRRHELAYDDFKLIKDHADARGMEMLATAGDLEGLDYILRLGLPAVKVGSTNITNTGLLEAIGESHMPVLLSTGASSLSEVGAAVELLTRKGAGAITLFHCTVQYPAEAHNLNLRAIPTLRAAFPGLKVAYSDHTQGPQAASAAVALGAAMLEKHFTLDNDMEGPDHWFCADPLALADYIEYVRTTETMLGQPNKEPAECEQSIRRLGRRFLTAMDRIPQGATIRNSMLRPRRTKVSEDEVDAFLTPDLERRVQGWTVSRDIAAGEPIRWTDVRAEL